MKLKLSKILSNLIVVFVVILISIYLVLSTNRLNQISSKTNFASYKVDQKIKVLKLTSNDLLLTQKDNGGTYYVTVGSIVGLDLDLDPTMDYAVSKSTNDVLVQNESPFVDNVHNKIKVVYHAVKRGKVQLSYVLRSPCYQYICTNNVKTEYSVYVVVN